MPKIKIQRILFNRAKKVIKTIKDHLQTGVVFVLET